MKIIKNTLSFIILSLLFIALFLFTFNLYTSMKQDEVDLPTEKIESTQKSFTESPVQPERKPNISDIKYAQALMSHKREQITDINVLRDYDGVLRTVKTNIDNGVANEEDYRLLEIHNGVYGGQDND